jgi:hypothetical protein
MPKEFLHDLYVCSTCLQQRRIRMSKGMPADSFGDASLHRSRPDVMSQEGLSPERELPLADRTGEKPSLSVDGSAQSDAKPEESEPNVDRGGLAFGMLLFCTDRLIV